MSRAQRTSWLEMSSDDGSASVRPIERYLVRRTMVRSVWSSTVKISASPLAPRNSPVPPTTARTNVSARWVAPLKTMSPRPSRWAVPVQLRMSGGAVLAGRLQHDGTVRADLE